MVIKPKFYDDFRCLAKSCRDTCCAGWEIDVDEDTADYYASLDGDDGEFVRSRLNMSDEGVTLCREGSRCGFLREDGLCELILRLGEDALCDICREHPRFYSGSEAITEAGHGLTCEEAARLWLTSPIEFVTQDDGLAPDESEQETLEAQMELIAALISEGALGETLAAMLTHGDDPYPRLRALYMQLEAMDETFGACFAETVQPTCDPRFRHLAAYFVYRYYFELGHELTVRFTAASLVMIAAMGGDLCEAAKKYSSEVEYDPDNLEKIYDFLLKTDGLAALVKRIFL